MAIPDHRIRFPAPAIDFATEVGTTGQEHDNYPQPGTQLRYDWMRLYLIGLLSNQSSASEPTEKREGTLWFNLSDIRIRRNGTWVSLAQAVKLDTDVSGNPVMLSDFYTSVQNLLSYKPTVSFSGVSAHDSRTSITIPTSLRSSLDAQSRPFLWIDGMMTDPRSCSLIGSPLSSINLSGISINSGQRFTVIIMHVGDSQFFVPDVVI